MITRHVTFMTGLTEQQQHLLLRLALDNLRDPEVLVRVSDMTALEFDWARAALHQHFDSAPEKPVVKIQFTRPVISVDRAAGKAAVFDDFTIVRPFRLYSSEDKVISELKEWIKQHTDIEPDIVFPRITKATVTTNRSVKRK